MRKKRPMSRNEAKKRKEARLIEAWCVIRNLTEGGIRGKGRQSEALTSDQKHSPALVGMEHDVRKVGGGEANDEGEERARHCAEGGRAIVRGGVAGLREVDALAARSNQEQSEAIKRHQASSRATDRCGSRRRHRRAAAREGQSRGRRGGRRGRGGGGGGRPTRRARGARGGSCGRYGDTLRYVEDTVRCERC